VSKAPGWDPILDGTPSPHYEFSFGKDLTTSGWWVETPDGADHYCEHYDDIGGVIARWMNEHEPESS
jgi:hypothetical protein